MISISASDSRSDAESSGSTNRKSATTCPLMKLPTPSKSISRAQYAASVVPGCGDMCSRDLHNRFRTSSATCEIVPFLPPVILYAGPKVTSPRCMRSDNTRLKCSRSHGTGEAKLVQRVRPVDEARHRHGEPEMRVVGMWCTPSCSNVSRHRVVLAPDVAEAVVAQDGIAGP